MKFDLDTVLVEKRNESFLKAYCVRFEFGKCQIEAFADVLIDALVDYAFGFHNGIADKYDRRILREAARSLYKIKGYENAKKLYLDNDSVLSIDEKELDEEQKEYELQIQKKGEFGELLLHAYMRDYFNTVPLLSKICFKDTDGFTVHGFDAVHIGKDPSDTNKDSLYLGESKLYYRERGNSGEAGVKDLAKDIKEHFYRDFLNREFALIAKKKDAYTPLANYQDKNTIDAYTQYLSLKDSWIERIQKVSAGKESLETLLSSVTVPVICTYESELFKKFENVSEVSFEEAYNKEVQDLNNRFIEEVKKIEVVKGEPIRTNLNIILILLPIPSKKEFVTLLHQKTWYQHNA